MAIKHSRDAKTEKAPFLGKSGNVSEIQPGVPNQASIVGSMSAPTKEQLKEKTLILSSAPGAPVSHRVDKPWRGRQRGFDILLAQGKLQDALVALAALPAPDKLTQIIRIAIRNKLPEIARRATLSRLEEEFLALTAAVTSCPAKRWPVLIRRFLRAHGWKQDLRGSPTKHPAKLQHRLRGEIIDGIMPKLKNNFDLKTKQKKKGGYESSNEVIESKLRLLTNDDAAVRAILRGRDLEHAACYYYYRAKYEPEVTLKTILNSYRRYRNSIGRPEGQ